MSLFDALIVAGLIATVWVNLYLSADRIVAEVRTPPTRPPGPHVLRWAWARIASGRRRWRG